MKKNKLKVNTLIKRKNLILALKRSGIKRISPGSVHLIEDFFAKSINSLASLLKEEILINGRKTLIKRDVQKAIKKLKKEESFWEI